MKKIMLVLAIVMTMTFCANAQSDGFFKANYLDDYDYRNGSGAGNEIGFALPAGHGYEYDTNAPLGSGLLIFAALGAGYALKKRRQ